MQYVGKIKTNLENETVPDSVWRGQKFMARCPENW